VTLARALLVLAVAVPLAARAGVVIEGKGKGEKPQRFVMDGQKLRMEHGDREYVIFDAAAKKMTQVQPAKGAYTEFTQADMDAMNAMVKQAQEQHGAPKADAKAWSVKYEKTGKSDSALGKSCDVYRMATSTGAEKTHDSEMCLAPFGAFGIDKGDFAAFRAFGEFASQMGTGRATTQSWADIPGVPLIGWDVDGGERKETFRATKVEKRSVPASEFTVPAGLKKGPNFAEQMKQLQQQMQGMQKPPKSK
jgi:hypothetical protein